MATSPKNVKPNDMGVTPVNVDDTMSRPTDMAGVSNRHPQPLPRKSDWAEPEDDPILDASRVPLTAYPQTPDSYVMYVWLHFLRPLLVVIFWVGVGIYAWRHFFRRTEDLDDVSLLGLYALIILGIFIIMLLIAPLRRAAREDEERHPDDGSTASVAVADHAKVRVRRLFKWRRARRLAVLHDHQGQLNAAADLDQNSRAAAAAETR